MATGTRHLLPGGLGPSASPKPPSWELKDAVSPLRYGANAFIQPWHQCSALHPAKRCTKPLWQGWEMPSQPLTIAPRPGQASIHPGPRWLGHRGRKAAASPHPGLPGSSSPLAAWGGGLSIKPSTLRVKAGAEIKEEPSYVKHKACALLGPYSRARSRQREHHVQGGIQAELKTSSQTQTYSS